MAADRPHGDAELGPLPASLEIGEHALGAIDGERKADSDVAAVRTDNGCVDADHVAGRIEQRTAAVAGVDRRVGLYHALQLLTVLAANRAAPRAYDAPGP